MNESIFDIDQLCCPVSQCLLYRFIKEYDSKKRVYLSYTVGYFILKNKHEALRITSEMTEIVFFKALH